MPLEAGAPAMGGRSGPAGQEKLLRGSAGVALQEEQSAHCHFGDLGPPLSTGVLLSLHGRARRPGGHSRENQPLWLSSKVKVPVSC